ncbi:MAG: GNAT family N-acetyltransferase [Candidatus Thorarchaeota archaeon]|jgi:ribosomal protein S18 acetylase RimI-like enzyme
MVDIHFSRATLDDVPDIVEINTSLIGSNDPGGFLVIEFEVDTIQHMIETNELQFYVAKNESGNILGYAQVCDRLDLSLLDDMIWINLELRRLAESILNDKYVYVKQLAVRRGYQRKGIASFIYENLEVTVGCPIVVFAATKPKRNEPSILFHEKNGYTHVSRLNRRDFGGFQEYESYFYVKQFRD